MKIKLIPRFNMTFNIRKYIKFFFVNYSLLPSVFKNNIYFTNYARSSLYLLLQSTPNKKLNVGVQAYTCHSVFKTIKKTGHKPVFIDLNENFKLNMKDLREKINQIDILIITHTFGYPENINEIRKISKDVIIIEDCSHSFLSKFQGEYTGTFGDASIFSLGLAKFPCIGHGGFALVNKIDKFPNFVKNYSKTPLLPLLDSLKSIFKILFFSLVLNPWTYGIILFRLKRINVGQIDLTNKFSFSVFRNSNWSNKIFSNCFIICNDLINRYKINSNKLFELLDNHQLSFLKKESDEPNYYIFPLLLNNRDSVHKELLKAGFESGFHFSKSIQWALEYGYKKGDCPKTENIVKKIITIPMHCNMKEYDIYKIAEIINKNYA